MSDAAPNPVPDAVGESAPVVDATHLFRDLAKAFNPNEGRADTGALFPSADGLAGADNTLAKYFTAAENVMSQAGDNVSILDKAINDQQRGITGWWQKFASIRKSIDIPGQFLSFARMTYMPDSTNSSILPWPGIDPEALKKIVMENVAPNLIIGMRIDDILLHSQLSQHVWRPGWRIELYQGDRVPSTQDKKDMREAERFLTQSSIDIPYDKSLTRDKADLTDFQRFLVAIVRDTLTFDMIAISTDRDSMGRIVQYAPIPAGNIRLVGPDGYEGKKDVWAVAVDEGGTVKKTFTREDLVLYVRNPRTDPEWSISLTRGYGTPELQTALKLVQIFQNVIDFNSDIFQRSGVPHGMLLLTGNGWTQRQVDLLTRMWTNLKKGISKAVALPVLAAPRDGKVEVIDFSRIKGDEAFYQDLLNLSIGCFCAVYRFPTHRLGYRISGKGPDTNRLEDKETPAALADNADPGKVALLTHIENLFNQYFIVPRWPNLRLRFTAKEPKADAREYEARRNAQTWAEARAEADLPDIMKDPLLKDNPNLKEMMSAMALCPIDPNLSGVFQSIISAVLKGESKEGEDLAIGNTMTSTKDPAKAEEHGKLSGVRRDSNAEKKPTTH